MKEQRVKQTLRRLSNPIPRVLSSRKLEDLIHAYEDLGVTLKTLRKTLKKNEDSLHAIDLKKLVRQLVVSKRRLERKITNMVLLEKQHLKRRLGDWASSFTEPRQ